jgi:hypothetical protein
VAINVDDARIPIIKASSRSTCRSCRRAGGVVQHAADQSDRHRAARAGDPGVGVANGGDVRLQSRDVWSAAQPASRSGAKGGFIHIPYLPEQAAAHPGEASMAVETVRRRWKRPLPLPCSRMAM